MRYIVEPIDQTDDYLPLFTEETSDTAADYRAQCQPAAAAAHTRRGGARYFCDESTSAEAESKSAGSVAADDDDVSRSEADMDCYSDDDNETRPINDKKTGKFYIYICGVFSNDIYKYYVVIYS